MIIVRRYQLRAPTEWPAEAPEQIRMRRELWNRLVEIENDHRARYTALTAADPSVIDAERTLEQIRERQLGLVAERKRKRQASRRKNADDPQIPAELAELKARAQAARAVLKEARRAARAGKLGNEEVRSAKAALAERKKERAAMLARRGGIEPPSAQELAGARAAVIAARQEFERLCADDPDTIPALELRRQIAVTAARKEFAARGLHWGNYNAVIASYETARERAIKTGGTLRFRGARRDATLTTQIQGGMSVAKLHSGGTGQIGLVPDPCGVQSRRRRDKMGRLHMRIAKSAQAEWPMLISAPLPEDASIKQAVVVRRRIAAQDRWTAVFTATRPAQPIAPAVGPAIAIDLGWRRIYDVGLRVATALADGSHASDFVVLPERILAAFARVEELRAERSGLHNEILARLIALPWDTVPPALAEIAARLRERPASSPARTARLALEWRGVGRDFDAPPYDKGGPLPSWRPEDFAAIEEWRRADKALWVEAEHLLDAAIARRTDFYRKAAARLADFAGVLVIEDFDIAAAARVETADGDETEQVRAARRYRQIAAPGEFRRWLLLQAAKRGVAVWRHQVTDPKTGRVRPAKSNAPHAACGHAHRIDDPAALRQRCSYCGAYYDVDENACAVMLSAWRTANGPGAPQERGPLAAD